MWTLTPRRTCDSERAVIDSLNTCCESSLTSCHTFENICDQTVCGRMSKGAFQSVTIEIRSNWTVGAEGNISPQSFVLLVIFDTTCFHNWPYNLNWFISDIYDIYIIYNVIYINQYFAMKLDSMCSAQGAGCGKVLKEFDHPRNQESTDRFEVKKILLIFSPTARP